MYLFNRQSPICNLKSSVISNWYWTPELKIVRHVAQPDGISQVDECSDVAYLEAEKERLEKKRLECLKEVESAEQATFKLYFEQLLSEVDYQLEYVNQRLSELRKPAELLGGKSNPAEIPPSKKTLDSSPKLLGGIWSES